MGIKDRWERINPSHRRKIILTSVLVALFGISAVITRINSERRMPKPVDTSVETHVMLPTGQDTTVEAISGQMIQVEKELESLRKAMEMKNNAMEEMMKKSIQDLKQQKTTDLESRIANLEKSLELLTEQLASKNADTQPSTLPEHRVPVPVIPSEVNRKGEEQLPSYAEPLPAAASAAPERSELRVIGAGSKTSDENQTDGSLRTISSSAVTGEVGATRVAKQDTERGPGGGTTARDLRAEQVRAKRRGDSATAWLPAGAIIQGVFLNGMDAPTASFARKNPVPAIIRIKHEAILPNRFRMDVRECFVLASGYGTLATERAELRTEKLSCVTQDGGVIETPLDGYLVGEDGKVGIRGRLVTKQGQMIAKSLLAGFFSGLAQASQPQQVLALDITPGDEQQVQFPDPANMALNGVLGGGSQAFSDISQFYLDMAKQMFPVVEVDAGRKATIIVIRGSSLRM